jgi:hypothetical protein
VITLVSGCDVEPVSTVLGGKWSLSASRKRPGIAPRSRAILSGVLLGETVDCYRLHSWVWRSAIAPPTPSVSDFQRPIAVIRRELHLALWATGPCYAVRVVAQQLLETGVCMLSTSCWQCLSTAWWRYSSTSHRLRNGPFEYSLPCHFDFVENEENLSHLSASRWESGDSERQVQWIAARAWVTYSAVPEGFCKVTWTCLGICNKIIIMSFDYRAVLKLIKLQTFRRNLQPPWGSKWRNEQCWQDM